MCHSTLRIRLIVFLHNIYELITKKQHKYACNRLVYCGIKSCCPHLLICATAIMSVLLLYNYYCGDSH